MTKITAEQFQALINATNWRREGYSNGILYREAGTGPFSPGVAIAFHADCRNGYYCDPKYAPKETP